MAIIENFDGVTAPAVPSDVTVVSGTWVTTETDAVSSPNSFTCTTGVGLARYNTILSSDDGLLEVNVFLGSGEIASLGSRISADQTTGYLATIQAISGGGFYLQKGGTSGGEDNIIGSVVPGGAPFPQNAAYKLGISCNGTSIQAYVQRGSDGLYINSSGSWVSGLTYGISATDASGAGPGYAYMASDTSSNAYFDNLAFTPATAGISAGSISVVSTTAGSISVVATECSGATGTVTHQWEVSDFALSQDAGQPNGTGSYANLGSNSLSLTEASLRPGQLRWYKITYADSGTGSSATSAPFTAGAYGSFVRSTGTGALTSDPFVLYVPASLSSSTPAPLVVMAHSSQQTQTQIDGFTELWSQANALGWRVACGDNGGENWGSNVGQAAYEDVIATVAAAYSTSCLLLFGPSMGGLLTQLEMIKQSTKHIAGVPVLGIVLVCPVCSLSWCYDSGGFNALIDAAYASSGGYSANVATHDPLSIIEAAPGDQHALAYYVCYANADPTVVPADNIVPTLAALTAGPAPMSDPISSDLHTPYASITASALAAQLSFFYDLVFPSPFLWFVLEPGGGSIDNAGNYIAPEVAGTYHVVAVQNSDPTTVGVSTVVVS